MTTKHILAGWYVGSCKDITAYTGSISTTGTVAITAGCTVTAIAAAKTIDLTNARITDLVRKWWPVAPSSGGVTHVVSTATSLLIHLCLCRSI